MKYGAIIAYLIIGGCISFNFESWQRKHCPIDEPHMTAADGAAITVFWGINVVSAIVYAAAEKIGLADPVIDVCTR